MATPFLGEIKIFAFNFPPRGWALCNGQLLAINQNQAIFSLLGTTYGGDGRVAFALPNLQGRSPLHTGSGIVLGQASGEETHTLSLSEIPGHTHSLGAITAPGNSAAPAGNSFAAHRSGYAEGASVALNPQTVGNAGGSQPHANLQPYLVLTFCISLQGIFPSPN